MMAAVAQMVTSATQSVNVLAARWVAAQPGDPDPSDGHGPEWGKAAPAGLLIWLFMGVALFFLIKSMNGHIKRMPKSFGASRDAGGSAARHDAVQGGPESDDTAYDGAAVSAGVGGIGDDGPAPDGPPDGVGTGG